MSYIGKHYAENKIQPNTVNSNLMSALAKVLGILDFVTQIGPAQVENFSEGMENKTWIEFKNDVEADIIVDTTIWGISTAVGIGIFAVGTSGTLGIGTIPSAIAVGIFT